MNEIQLDLEFCCTCLKVGSEDDKFLSISFAPPEDISFENKLRHCVPEMGLDNADDFYLCKPCSVALETAYIFRCMCLKTDKKLKEFGMSHVKSRRNAERNIKLELLEAMCTEEISIEPEQKYDISAARKPTEADQTSYSTSLDNSPDSPVLSVASEDNDLQTEDNDLQTEDNDLQTEDNDLQTEDKPQDPTVLSAAVENSEAGIEEIIEPEQKYDISAATQPEEADQAACSTLLDNSQDPPVLSLASEDNDLQTEERPRNPPVLFAAVEDNDAEIEEIIDVEEMDVVELLRNTAEQYAKESPTKIETVKDQLGSLLTESLGNAIDIFDKSKNDMSEFNSQISIFNSLNAEIEELTKEALFKQPELPKKDVKSAIANTIKAPETQMLKNLLEIPRPRLSDAEILKNACETIPELYNCPVEALNCQVTLEKITVTSLTVKLPSTKKSKKVKRAPCGPKNKPFWCNKCKKYLCRRNRFNSHMLRHSNIRAYKCNVCPQAFFASDALSKHRKICGSLKTPPDGEATTIKAPTSVKNDSKGAVSSIKVSKTSVSKGKTKVKKHVPSKSRKRIVENKEKITYKFKASYMVSKQIRKSQRKQTMSSKALVKNDDMYHCELCNYRSIRKDNYQLHLYKHNNDRKFKCEPCSKSWFERWELNRHLRDVHSIPTIKNSVKKTVTPKAVKEKPKIPENHIQKTVTRKPVKENSKLDKTYDCELCSFQSYYKQKYKVHLLRHSNDKRFKCEHCSKGFYENHELNRHLRNIHFIPTIKNSAKKTVTPKTAMEKPKIYENHIQETPKTVKEKPLENNFFSSVIEPAITLTVNQGPLMTPIVQSIYSFSTSTTPDEPIETLYSCKRCNISFKSRNLLLLHTQTHEWKHRCNMCEQEFNSEKDLQEHAQSHQIVAPEFVDVEDGEQMELETPPKKKKWKYFCTECQMEFSSRDHANIHTGAKPYQCKVCGKYFAAYTTLRKHKFIHKKQDGVQTPSKMSKQPAIQQRKKYFCTECQMEFSSRDHANIHTGTKPYQCKVCGKHFAAYTTMRKHKFIHKKQDGVQTPSKKSKQPAIQQRKKYSCEVCHKEFMNKKYVYTHTCQSASGEAVYRCQICKKPFFGRTALIEHMGMHINSSETPTE